MDIAAGTVTAVPINFYPRNGGDFAVSLDGRTATIWRRPVVASARDDQGWHLGPAVAVATATWNGYALVDVVPAVEDDVVAAAEDCIAAELVSAPASALRFAS